MGVKIRKERHNSSTALRELREVMRVWMGQGTGEAAGVQVDVIFVMDCDVSILTSCRGVV